MTEFAATGAFTVPMGDAIAATPLDGDLDGAVAVRRKVSIRPGCAGSSTTGAATTTAPAPATRRPGPAIHYFASRAPQEAGPAHLAGGQRLDHQAPAGDGRRQGEDRAGRHRVAREGSRWLVSTPEARWIADAVIFAAPSFLAARVIDEGPATPDFQYSPWLTANLTLDRWPSERGAPDGVGQRDRGLAVAGLRRGDAPVAADARPADRVDVLLGARRRAATCQPRVAAGPGLAIACHEDSRRPLARASRHSRVREPHRHLPHGPRDDPAHAGISVVAGPPHLRAHGERLFFAHSDVSGLSLFEEAQHRGVAAADRALAFCTVRARPVKTRTEPGLVRWPEPGSDGTLRDPGGLMRRARRRCRVCLSSRVPAAPGARRSTAATLSSSRRASCSVTWWASTRPNPTATPPPRRLASPTS